MGDSVMNQSKPKRAPRLAGAEHQRSDYGPSFVDDMDDEDDDIDPAKAMHEVICVYTPGPPVRFQIGNRRMKMVPGQIEKLEAAYATPIQHRPGGDPLPSVVDQLTNRMVLPVADPRVKKDEHGTPLLHLEYQAAKARKADALRQAKATT